MLLKSDLLTAIERTRFMGGLLPVHNLLLKQTLAVWPLVLLLSLVCFVLSFWFPRFADQRTLAIGYLFFTALLASQLLLCFMIFIVTL
jgi:hypothetical protein